MAIQRLGLENALTFVNTLVRFNLLAKAERRTCLSPMSLCSVVILAVVIFLKQAVFKTLVQSFSTSSSIVGRGEAEEELWFSRVVHSPRSTDSCEEKHPQNISIL
ncbi:hypothetical protein ILYODFUR_032582 [Ilyodon furcidens]|uniref:Uncharacterized protein n=1 Tax=Ilyodon furcidens TaxID=33524 RepID=A0ABV0UKX5_9TELE